MQEPTGKDSLQEGWQALRKRDFAAAALAFGRGVAIEPGNPLYRHGAAVAARRLGDLDRAEIQYRAAMTTAAHLQDDGGVRPTVIAMRLVDLYRSQGRCREAEELCLEVLTSKELRQSNTARSRFHACLGDLYRRQGRLVAAEHAYRTAIAHRRRVFGDQHPKTIQLLPRLADVCRRLGRWAEADDLLRRADSTLDNLHHIKAVGHA